MTDVEQQNGRHSGSAGAKPVDHVGSRMGMWIFLVTEILLFGGLFVIYAVYRAEHTAAFHEAAAGLNLVLGTANTVILLTSSLTVVLAIRALRSGRPRASTLLILVTVLCAVLFLVNKYFGSSRRSVGGIGPICHRNS